MSDLDLDRICAECLHLNATAFAGHAEIAYHALAASLHAAHDAGDSARLEEIAVIAARQAEALTGSGGPLSAAETSATVALSRIYASLVQQARTMATTLAMRRRPIR
jgi:hypothetical protein